MLYRRFDEDHRTVKILLLLTLLAFISASTGLLAEQSLADEAAEGKAAMNLGQWDRAVQHFTAAIKKNPKVPMVYQFRAMAYSKLGRYDESIRDLKRVIELDPDFTEAYHVLGVVYEIKKDYESALKVYRAALPRVKSPSAQRMLKKWIKDMEDRIGKK